MKSYYAGSGSGCLTAWVGLVAIHKSSVGQRGDFEGTALPLSFYTEACSTAPPHPHCQEVSFTTAPKYQPANHVLKL